jgi:dethiobiotin synthetase
VSRAILVTGTDTDVGKTVFCAGLARLLDGFYWKPVQSGLSGETDSQTVQRLSGLGPERILAEAYRLKTAASPHLAAELEGVRIDEASLVPPQSALPLVIEGAGGLLVPLNRRTLYIDVFARWRLPTVLCARTRLGTINHTLLSIEALRRRRIPLLGVALIGEEHAANQQIIASLGRTRILGRLPLLDPLSPATLSCAFERGFSCDEFRAAAAGPARRGGQLASTSSDTSRKSARFMGRPSTGE